MPAKTNWVYGDEVTPAALNTLGELLNMAEESAEIVAAVASLREGAPTAYDTLNKMAVKIIALEGGVASTVTLTNAVTMTNKTLTAPVINGNVTGTYTLGGTPTLTSARVNQLMDTGGLVALIINPVASAVNRLQISGAVTTGAPYVMAIGPDTNIDLNLRTTGTGVVRANGVELVTLSGTQVLTGKTLTAPRITSGILDSSGLQLLGLQATASAANYINIISRATGVAPTVEAIGADTDIDLLLRGKGLGRTTVTNLSANAAILTSPRLINGVFDSNGVAVLGVAATASAVNYWQVQNAVAGSGPNLFAVGADTNVAINMWTKGNGAYFLRGGDGNVGLIIAPATGGINGIRIDSAVTGSSPSLQVTGADAVINLNIQGKSTGRVIVTNLTTSGQAIMLDPRFNRVFDYTNNVEVARFNGAAGAVNFLSFSAGIAGVGVFFNATGSDTDVSINLSPKGAGRTNVTNLSATSAILTSPRIVTAIYDTNGAIALAIIPTASAVNYVQITNNAAAGPVYISANGTDTNIQIYLRSRGTGAILLTDGSGVPILVAQPTASAVNYFQMVNAAAAGALYIQAIGTDTNIPMAYYSKGSGYFAFESLQNGRILRLQAGTAATVNYVNITSGITTVGPTIAAAGETNVQLNIAGAGSSGVRITGSTAGISVLGVGTDTTTAVVVSRDNSAVTSMLRVTSAGLTANAGVQEILRIDPVISQTAAGGYRMISVNMTATSVGSGEKSLLWLGIASSQKFRVDDSGATTTGKTTTAGRPSAVTAGEGAMMYDTDLDIPIYSNGAIWRNAVGAAV